MKPNLLRFTLATFLATTGVAQAQPGVRFGLTDDPDSIFAGFFYEAPISRSRSGWFVLEPGVDLGFGDDVDFFSVRGTLNGKYLIPMSRNVALYPIVGMSLYYINVDCGNNRDCDDTSAGLNLGGGMRFDRFNLEFTLGVSDIPDLTFNFGFVF